MNSAIAGQIAEPYADALMSLAEKTGAVDAIGNDIRALLTLFQDAPEFLALLQNPVVKSEDKKSVIRKVGVGLNQFLINFMLLLVDKRRIVFVKGIAEKYLDRLRALENIALAEVTSAQPLNESQTTAISERIKQFTKASSVELKTSIDPDLIGGVIIKVGSQVIDTSIRGQLRRISLNLIGS
jgi:F-type H+-transporting ATPase subunit delta